MQKPIKIVVAHPMQQHSYHTASALQDAGMLDAYITTVYYNPQRMLYKILKRILGEQNVKRMAGKRIEDESIKVVQFCEILGLVYLFLLRVDRKKIFLPFVWKTLCRRFGKCVYRYSKEHGVDGVFMFDTTAADCFNIIKKKGLPVQCILDSTSIPQTEICKIIETEQAKKYNFQHSLAMRLKSAKKNLAKNNKELALADVVLAGSTYCANLVKGVLNEDKKVYVVPYGVDIDAFTIKEYHEAGNPIRFLYVGGLEATKGSYYILEAFKTLDREDVALICVGDCGYAKDELAKYKNVEFKGFVPSTQMPNVYKAADVYIIPSLYEGLSRSLVEAMASGLPAIASTSSGGLDLVCQGENGFIISPADIEGLQEKIIYFCEHKEEISKMGECAATVASKYTWKNYKEILINTIEEIWTNEAKDFNF